MARDSMVSVVVPVCNEQANLPELRTRLAAALGDHEFECILVDDGSADATAAMVRDFAREDPRFKLVSLSRNFGHQAAIVAGLTFARRASGRPEGHGLEAPGSGGLWNRAVFGRPAPAGGSRGCGDLHTGARGGSRRAARRDACPRERARGRHVPLRPPAPRHRVARRVRRPCARGGPEPPDLRGRRRRRVGPEPDGTRARIPRSGYARVTTIRDPTTPAFWPVCVSTSGVK